VTATGIDVASELLIHMNMNTGTTQRTLFRFNSSQYYWTLNIQSWRYSSIDVSSALDQLRSLRVIIVFSCELIEIRIDIELFSTSLQNGRVTGTFSQGFVESVDFNTCGTNSFQCQQDTVQGVSDLDDSPILLRQSESITYYGTKFLPSIRFCYHL